MRQKYGQQLGGALLFVVLEVSASIPQINISTAPPAGFEALTEPQTSLVDIYYGDRYLTSQLATFQPDQIQFSAPASIVKALPRLSILLY